MLPSIDAKSFLLPSPFEVQVSPEAGTQKVRAWGPGLETGQVGKSADFVVEAIGTEVGTLGKWLGGRRGVIERIGAEEWGAGRENAEGHQRKYRQGT